MMTATAVLNLKVRLDEVMDAKVARGLVGHTSIGR